MVLKGFSQTHFQINEISCKNIVLKNIIAAIIFIAASFWEFLYLELFFNKAITDFPTDIIIKNVVLIMLVNLMLVSILHSMRAAFLISSVFMLAAGIVNFFIISFRGYGIVYMDFYAIKTAATVAGRYSYSITPGFVAACFTGAAGILTSFYMPHMQKGSYFKKETLIASFSGILVSVLFIAWINFDATFFKGVSSITWDHNIGISDYGYLLYFTANAGRAEVSRPEGYSVERADKILSAYAKDEKEEAVENGSNIKNGVKPNIIMIMNESFSDLRVLGSFNTDTDVMGFYDSLNENTIKGYVQSSVYGGYTSNSEFEFLTGCSKVFLPGNPYLQYMDGYLPSIISNIKSQEGYDEAVAIHPYNPSGYNRNRVYPLLGFDRFLSADDFEEPVFVRDYISDWSDYHKIEELYEQKKEGSLLCVFNVTMQNHNPYSNTSYKFKDNVHITSFASTLQAEQYLSLMKMSDKALEQLITYFKNVSEPVIILLFGDHQPHLPDLFYKDVMGKEPLQFTREDTMLKHKVPFLIWANYDIPGIFIENASINYLSSIFLDAAGLEMSNFNRYLLGLYKKLPAISAAGSYDSEGKLHENTEKDNLYAKLMEEYEIVQYNYLFDNENRLDKHFTIK